MFSDKRVKRELVIAGNNAGKSVTITPQAEPIYHEMVKLARRGNHWAQLSVNGINDLAAGRLHQNNIFIKPNSPCRGGTEEFFVILPGCKLTAEKQPDDTFKVLHLEANLDYAELQKEELRPGLYSAEVTDGAWSAKYQAKNKIKNSEFRLVAITDSAHESPDSAADKCFPRITAMPTSGGERQVNAKGFDMHYTPGEKSIGGLKNLKQSISPEKISDIHESALLLAQTMYKAKNIQGVAWISEFGGSAILTQALAILAHQGIKLDSHTAFLYRPTTSPNKAYQAANAVGLTFDRKFSKTHALDVIGNSDQLKVIASRRKNETNYGMGKAAADTFEYGKGVMAAVGTIAASGGVTLAAPAAAVTFLTALASAASIAKLGSTLTEAYLPSHHDKIKGKF
ncbi:hypothetical protein EDC56_2835 [Sinobacterium caligoides]|uniref:Uncharacterized protein n=1 Tax=Sinobacterium caligoides TaxID=933926 RepID=A0A3N2DK88_9GAMM|nr:hypothetical protein [Sinobacterium caligoides]ROS00197.1 hypothetical protein EDC56_2835 [Sinobacterium caligoides]